MGQQIANRALSHLGSTAWGSGTETYCETFTEQMAECGWQGGSAIEAWRNNAARQLIGVPAAVGYAVYFGPHPENEGNGHTGIVTGTNEFTSVTDFGVQTYSISGWVAPLLGYIHFW